MREKRDDKALIMMLYNRYEQRIYRIAYSILNDSYRAEDAVSETFIKLMNKTHRLWTMNSEQTESYVVKIAKSTAIDQYRRNQKEMNRIVSIDTDSDREKTFSQTPIEDVLSEIGSEQSVKELIEQLPDKYKDVMLCMAIHEMSGRETALMLSLSETVVRKRYERAKKLLKKKITDTDKEVFYNGRKYSF